MEEKERCQRGFVTIEGQPWRRLGNKDNIDGSTTTKMSNVKIVLTERKVLKNERFHLQ